MCSSHTTFVDLCLDGKVDMAAIDDFVAQWHESDADITIEEFLGMTKEEYAAWVEEPWILRHIFFARTHNIPLRKAIRWADGKNVAARCSDLKEAKVLKSWLKRPKNDSRSL